MRSCSPVGGEETIMVSVVSAVVAVFGAVLTAVLGFWWQIRIAAATRLDHMSRYRDSLLWAAFDLQSRVYNILLSSDLAHEGPGRGFIRFFLEGPEALAQYARHSTAFVFAEYFGWVEIIRRDIRFLDLGKHKANQQLIQLVSNISETINISGRYGPAFRVFRSEQRAIGELMIAPGSEPGSRSCIGYVEFCRRLSEEEQFAFWMEDLVGGVDHATTDMATTIGRLLSLQHQLIDLLDFLDPKKTRFPADKRLRY
jgi:hypothetical protein